MIGPDPLNAWQVVGTAAAMALSGAVSFFLGRKQRTADDAAADAEATVISTMRHEFTRLAERVSKLEAREVRLRSHIWQLERTLRDAGIDPPVLDVEGE